MVKLILAFLFTFNILAAQSEKSFDYMLKLEGFRNLPYDDATGKTLTKKQILSGDYKGKPHIGYGTLIPKNWFEKEWVYEGVSKSFARNLAKQHPIRNLVNREVLQLKIELTQDQEDVLHEAGYNLGHTVIRKLVKLINVKGVDAAADRLLLYVKQNGKVVKGLVKRRKKEAKRLRG